MPNVAIKALAIAFFPCIAAASTLPPPTHPDLAGGKVTPLTRPLASLTMGKLDARFEGTPLSTVRDAIKADSIAHQGEAGTSEYWLCYTAGAGAGVSRAMHRPRIDRNCRRNSSPSNSIVASGLARPLKPRMDGPPRPRWQARQVRYHQRAGRANERRQGRGAKRIPHHERLKTSPFRHRLAPGAGPRCGLPLRAADRASPGSG